MAVLQRLSTYQSWNVGVNSVSLCVNEITYARSTYAYNWQKHLEDKLIAGFDRFAFGFGISFVFSKNKVAINGTEIR